MAGRTSWEFLEADDSEEVPQVDWKRVKVTEDLGEGRNCVVFGAIFKLGDGRTVEAVVKQSKRGPRWSRVHQEAEVLQALAGVRGVPRLYGVTKTSPQALVMSRCRGTTVKELRKLGRTRTCLTAVLGLCSIVSAVHKRHVCHRDLHGGNILYDSTDRDEDGDVSLVDFGQARMYATKLSIEVDMAQVNKLLRNILRKMLQDSDQDAVTVRRCNNVLKSLASPPNLREIARMVRYILHG